MDRESVERLRFDRRLQRRRGWVEQSDFEAHLESLADTSDKMIRGIDESDESDEPGETRKADAMAAAVPEQAAEPALAEASTTPPAADFSATGSFSGGGSESS
jgi:hypothetical protein